VALALRREGGRAAARSRLLPAPRVGVVRVSEVGEHGVTLRVLRRQGVMWLGGMAGVAGGQWGSRR
jgi:hypothetical protein